MNSLSQTFQRLDTYLDLCIDMICSRCSANTLTHHKGTINTFLKPKKKIPSVFFEKYFEDTEHGLFHGIMCGFIISLIHEDKNMKKEGLCIMEKEYCSAFLHDFLKCNEFAQEEHDRCLSEFYPELKNETYVHSNPPENLQCEYLIIADRIELTRYEDNKSWVDDRYKNIFINLEDNTRCCIEQFYAKIRNVLLHFFQNSNSIFLRHGLELLNKVDCDKESLFPPKNSYLEVCDGYPIEIDRPPFGVLENWKTNATNGACSNHGLECSWNKVKGYITFTQFCNLDGTIIDSKERDHLYAISEIKLKNWVFMYQNINEDDSQIKQLIDNDIDIIPQQIINKFYTFTKLLKDRLIVLNYCI